jgi:anti-sigma B factor antagonist
VVLDMGDVDFIDSAGLGALAASCASARNQGTSLKLANVTKKIVAVLYITKIINTVEVYESVGDAVLSFGQIS